MESAKEKPKKSKIKIIIILSITGLVIVLIIGVVLFFDNAMWHYEDPYIKKVTDAGFVEKTVRIGDVVMNYAEGPDNGPPLLLLHPQTIEWNSYNLVLPELSKLYHIFAPDFHGHGKTKSPDNRYRGHLIGRDFASFIQNVIGGPVFITGNSSGGLLTAWLAANNPELTRKIILEDPPFFSSEYPRIKKTIAYELFSACNDFINSDEDDFLIYWIEHSPGVRKSAGDKKIKDVVNFIQNYRKKNPGKPTEVVFMPTGMRMFMRSLENYDPRFGVTFYNGIWHEDFDHEEILKKITCPAILIHANFNYNDNGILMGAMDDNDAGHAASLIKDCDFRRIDSGHTVHQDKPKEFIRIVRDFFK